MANVIYDRDGTRLTPEEMAMLDEAEKRPIVYDEDCPKLTPEQLAQFRPVHYSSMEKREQAIGRQEAPVFSVS